MGVVSAGTFFWRKTVSMAPQRKELITLRVLKFYPGKIIAFSDIL
jgi:hypothetical protein